MAAYRTAFNRRINPAFGSLYINVVTLQHLEKAIEGLSYDPAKDVKDLMSRLFQRAMADGFVQTNPTTLLSLPEKNSKEIPAWNPEEIEKLWTAYGHGNRIAAACLLMIYTGMMPGELLQLKSDMIDFEKKTIVGCGLKTKERKEKPIVLSDIIIPVLHDMASTTRSNKGFVLGMNKDNFYDQFQDMKKEIGIRAEVRPYSSRHSTATELELLGVSPSVIASVLRHKSYATTAKHYMDISIDKALEAVGKIDHKPKEAVEQ
jgi:integrase